MEIQVKTLAGKEAGTLTLSDAVFGLEPRADILHRMVRWQLAKRQAGHAQDQDARRDARRRRRRCIARRAPAAPATATRRAPQFRGGGKAFGPVVRDHAFDLPKKVRALALKHALSAKAKAEALVVRRRSAVEGREDQGARGAVRRPRPRQAR